ncbi:MAG: catalase, partial [Chloroflexota bacterium]
EEMLNDLAERIQQMQDKARAIAQKRNPDITIKRGFHAKGTGLRAKFHVYPDLPRELRVGLFQPAAEYDAVVRFSNARGEVLSDLAKDQRGIAIRVKAIQDSILSLDDDVNIQDFLMTNTPISFARNPVQFIEVGEILLEGTAKVPGKLIQKYGFAEARRIMSVFLAPIVSFNPLQMNQYWSRTSFQFGETSMRFLIRPSKGSKTLSSTQQFLGVLRSVFQGVPQKDIYMREKLLEALKAGDLRFDFCVQLFVDDKKTPIEDAYIEWIESDSPPIPVATLIIPKQDDDEKFQKDMGHVAFNPWHTKDHTPLGLINLARQRVYISSAIHRGAYDDRESRE